MKYNAVMFLSCCEQKHEYPKYFLKVADLFLAANSPTCIGRLAVRLPKDAPQGNAIGIAHSHYCLSAYSADRSSLKVANESPVGGRGVRAYLFLWCLPSFSPYLFTTFE